MDAASFPSIPKDLIERLETEYPEVVPAALDSLSSLMLRGGARALVKWLRMIHEEQTNPSPDENEDVQLEA